MYLPISLRTVMLIATCFCFVRFVAEFMGLAEINCCETVAVCDYTVWHFVASCKVVLALAHKDLGV